MRHKKLLRKIINSLLALTILLSCISGLQLNFVNAVADDGFPVAPPAGSEGLTMKDYFELSKASVPNAPVTSRFSTAYPQAVVITKGPPKKDPWQLGGIWSKQKIDLNAGFTYKTAHFFGNKNLPNGGSTYNDSDADGMTFTLQNDPLGSSAFGSPAGGLGAYPWSTNGQGKMIKNYIRNALSIEMDSYFNNSGVADDQFDINMPYNPNGHIAVVRPGDTPLKSTKSAEVGHLQFNILPELLSNSAVSGGKEGYWKNFTVSWTPEVRYTNGKRILGGELFYSLEGNPNHTITANTFKIDNVLDYFSSDHVLYGYTGATGPSMTFQAAAIMKLPQNAKPVELHFQDSNGVALQDPVILNGEIDEAWNGADYRPEWIKKDGVWYQYNQIYTANTPDQKDQGTFSATNGYVVTYQYIKRDPPEKYALIKQVRNLTTNTDYDSETKGKAGDTVSYQLDYTNLTGISSGIIHDDLDSDLTYQRGSLEIANDDTGWKYETVDDADFINGNQIRFPYDISSGQRFSVRLQAKVVTSPSSQESIPNQATVSDNGSNKTVTSNQVLINLPTTNLLTIKKIDAKDEQKTLAGAKFEITDNASGSVTQELSVTGADGLTTFEPSDAGERVLNLQEIQAPNGYSLNDSKYQIRWNQAAGILGIRQEDQSSWEDTTTDGLLKVVAGQLVFANQKPGKITVRDYDRATGQILTTATYEGPLGKRLSELNPGSNLPGSYPERYIWGVTMDESLPPVETLDTYDPQTPPDPIFTDQPQTMTYVFDQKMFELNPDETIEFGEFSTNQLDRNYLIGEMSNLTKQTLPFGLNVTDRIGLDSWQLSVREEKQFENELDGSKLADAELWFKNMSIHSQNSRSITSLADYQFELKDDFSLVAGAEDLSILTATAISDSEPVTKANSLLTRNWRIDFGDQSNGGISVGLKVPRKTVRLKGRYQTKLTWTASMLP
ncbi:lectin-like domain-containing protein [Lapidilactobacillus wuchangensis]|uniref:lectin-like domain-containing protein n=1 Tax=Lapidilactobacillus wuchangensis TaxID=2486001 RepID=UPI0013DE3B1E|nr:WxL domain-containing protein [Lapidilactobacillus wuchangensis]